MDAKTKPFDNVSPLRGKERKLPEESNKGGIPIQSLSRRTLERKVLELQEIMLNAREELLHAKENKDLLAQFAMATKTLADAWKAVGGADTFFATGTPTINKLPPLEEINKALALAATVEVTEEPK